ncbi:hypothetical protein BVI1335_1520002 [Burkholderia vietnamiensis]|nr:hypothetical protein BVI1335_1520002 [Burkholderia vietnamiensis]
MLRGRQFSVFTYSTASTEATVDKRTRPPTDHQKLERISD